MYKRLRKDINELIIKNYQIYTEEKNKIYTLILSLQRYIHPYIIQYHIIPYILSPSDNFIYSTFTIKTVLDKHPLNIKFLIPKEYPFKPPRFTINKISGCKLKNLGQDNSHCVELLHKKFSIFGNEWSPAIKLIDCIDTILLAIKIHLNLKSKSPFLIECFK